MLTLTPVVCLSAAMTISKLIGTYLDPILPSSSVAISQNAEAELLAAETRDGIPEAPLATSTTTTPAKSKKKDKSVPNTPAAASHPAAAPVSSQPAEAYKAPLASKRRPQTTAILSTDLRMLVLFVFTSLLGLFVLHCTWVTSNAYSSPSVVLASRGPDGSQNIIDDFREAYYWLRRNTAEDAKIMSWWDYGYQVSGPRASSELQSCGNSANNRIAFFFVRSRASPTVRPWSTTTPGITPTLRRSAKRCHPVKKFRIRF